MAIKLQFSNSVSGVFLLLVIPVKHYLWADVCLNVLHFHHTNCLTVPQKWSKLICQKEEDFRPNERQAKKKETPSEGGRLDRSAFGLWTRKAL